MENSSTNRNLFDGVKCKEKTSQFSKKQLAQEVRAAVVSAMKQTKNTVFVLNVFLKFERLRRRVLLIVI